MSVKNVDKIILICIALLYSATLFGEGPIERYHVLYEEISKDVLKNTIGILTLNSGVKGGKDLRTYLKVGEQFIYSKTLEVRGETTPISNFGWRSPIDKFIYNYRYPIVAKFGQYLCIVYEPTKNLKTWISIEEIKEQYFPYIVMLDSIKTPSRFVDIFYFTKSGRRKVYKEPLRDADFIIISTEESKYPLLNMLEQKNGFIKIGIVHVDFDTDEQRVEPLGWIRLKDDQGKLTIWIKYVDLH